MKDGRRTDPLLKTATFLSSDCCLFVLSDVSFKERFFSPTSVHPHFNVSGEGLGYVWQGVEFGSLRFSGRNSRNSIVSGGCVSSERVHGSCSGHLGSRSSGSHGRGGQPGSDRKDEVSSERRAGSLHDR